MLLSSLKFLPDQQLKLAAATIRARAQKLYT